VVPLPIAAPDATRDSNLAAAAGREPPDAPRVAPARLRVLLVKRDKLGDLLLTTPLIRDLANAAGVEVHVLANDYNAWVVDGNDDVACTWTYPRTRDGGRLRVASVFAQWRTMRRLRDEHYDFAVVMGGDESHRGIRRAIASGAARVVAFAAQPARYGRRLTDPLPPPAEGHETQRMRALLAPIAAAHSAVAAMRPGSSNVDTPRFALPADAGAFARRWLDARSLRDREYVVIGAGARRAKKRPSPEQVARWASRLHRDFGLSTVFVWTPGTTTGRGYPGDDALAADVVARGLPFLHPYRGPIRETLGLVFHAATSVFPDSGLMHFAAASTGGVLGLFADPADSSPAERWAPLGPRARHLEAAKHVADLDDDAIFDALAPLLRTWSPGK
jgi:ADP-heptose:LPS heptosyltransferase